MKDIKINLTEIKDYHFSEEMKSLRSNIEFSGAENKSIVLTSCMPNEGKSTLSLQLALSLASAGKKVMFIDADLRKSVMMGRYHIKGEIMGLTNFLAGRCAVDDILYRTNTKGLYTIFTGPVPPNPSELLGSKRFTGLMKSLREVYDYVIIDAPPIGAVIDAAVIAKNCDATILVISAGNISRNIAIHAKKQMEQSGCKIIGAVLNKVNTQKDGYYGRYYGKYYGSYYGHHDENDSSES